MRRRLPALALHGPLIGAAVLVLLIGGMALAGVRPQTLLAPAVLTAPLVFSLNTLLTSLIAGVSLQIRQPFGPGDAVTIGGATGTVVHLGLLTVSLRAADGSRVSVPNAQFLSAIFSVHAPDPPQRSTHATD